MSVNVTAFSEKVKITIKVCMNNIFAYFSVLYYGFFAEVNLFTARNIARKFVVCYCVYLGTLNLK